MLYGKVNMLVPQDTYERIADLSEAFGTKTAVVIEAIDMLYERVHEAKPDISIGSSHTVAAVNSEGYVPPSETGRIKGKRAPLGQKWDRGRLVDDPETLPVLKELLRLWREVGLGATDIVRRLNDSRQFNRGKDWTRSSVNWHLKRHGFLK